MHRAWLSVVRVCWREWARVRGAVLRSAVSLWGGSQVGQRWPARPCTPMLSSDTALGTIGHTACLACLPSPADLGRVHGGLWGSPGFGTAVPQL